MVGLGGSGAYTTGTTFVAGNKGIDGVGRETGGGSGGSVKRGQKTGSRGADGAAGTCYSGGTPGGSVSGSEGTQNETCLPNSHYGFMRHSRLVTNYTWKSFDSLYVGGGGLLIIYGNKIFTDIKGMFESYGKFYENYWSGLGYTDAYGCGSGSINIFANELENFSSSNFDVTSKVGNYNGTRYGGVGTYNYGTIKTGIYSSSN